MFFKDLKKHGINLYGEKKAYIDQYMAKHGITVKKLKTEKHKRLEDGYKFIITSTKSYQHIIDFFKDGGINIFEKERDDDGNIIYNKDGRAIYKNLHLFYYLKLEEQFFITNRTRLFKGYEEYNDIHRLTFDIETTGLRPEISRVFAIGMIDNRGFQDILETDKIEDDEAERKLIYNFFYKLIELKPAIINGYNSEDFDFYFILHRAKKLGIDIKKITTTLSKEHPIKRLINQTVKIGGDTVKYTATKIWGISVIDIFHAVKKAAKLDTDIKKHNLKYIAKYNEVAKKDRTYIKGENNDISKFYYKNSIFIVNEKNEYAELPDEFQKVGKELYELQHKQNKLEDTAYNKAKKEIILKNIKFVDWFKSLDKEKNYKTFKTGKELVKQYLLGDIWETQQVDEIYNQVTFLFGKIVPTTFSRVATMGNASMWNLLMTAWSYEKKLAIPIPDKNVKFSGGLSRCYKKGYNKNVVKIDYNSLYPMIQLTWDVFPFFDITRVLKKMLLYLTITRNIYKHLGNSEKLTKEEELLLKTTDHHLYERYKNGDIKDFERKRFKVKQHPIKIINNSQFGSLGSGIAFNWSHNTSANRITVIARLKLRQAIIWFFENFELKPLYAVTDGINFEFPEKTKVKLTDEGINEGISEGIIEEMWQYHGKKGVDAVIEYYNDTIMEKPYMGVGNDGVYHSTYNVSRINFATLKYVKKNGKKTKKISFTGNSLKSSTMPEYIEIFMNKGLELILEGKGKEFIDYYYDYVKDIYYKRIPIKQIANKSRYKVTIKGYLNRGKDKNGREKGKQAHMELIIEDRERIAEKLFEEHKDKLNLPKPEDKLTIKDKIKLVNIYMPPEPDLDSTIYYYNTGYRKSHGDSKMIKDQKTGELRMASSILYEEDILENPNFTTYYNVDKYLENFNKKVSLLLLGFDPKIQDKILVKIERKIENGKLREELVPNENFFTEKQLELKDYNLDDLDESMYMGDKERVFWNDTGYSPWKIWDGFKEDNERKIYYEEIYLHALNYLNKKMEDSGKRKRIKAIDDKLEKNDLFLIKNKNIYQLGFFNGEFTEIIKDVNIPKSEIEIKLENEKNKKEAKEKMIKMLEKDQQEKLKYFKQFRVELKILDTISMDDFLKNTDGKKVFENYIKLRKQQEAEYEIL